MRGFTKPTMAAVAVGGVLFLFGVFGDGHLDVDDFRSLGGALIVCVLTRAFTSQARGRDEMIWKHGHEIGREIGFREGRKVGPTRIIPINGHVRDCQEDVSLIGTADHSG